MFNNKTMLLQLFAEEAPVVEESAPTEPVEQAEPTTEPVEEPTEPVSYRDLDYKYKDEKGKLSDYSPEDVVTNFQLGKKYKEHEADIALTKRLKEMYGVSDVDALNKLFDDAIDANIREAAPEGIPEDQMDKWVEFQKAERAKEAQRPEKEREATMLAHVEALKATGKIKSINDVPDAVFDIYKNRGYGDLEGAFDSYELQKTKTKLKESENAASSPGSLKGQAVIPKAKSIKDMSPAEYEAHKEARRALAAQANGG